MATDFRPRATVFATVSPTEPPPRTTTSYVSIAHRWAVSPTCVSLPRAWTGPPASTGGPRNTPDETPHALRRMPANRVDSVSSSRCLQHVVAGQAQSDTEHFSCIRVVFDHEDPVRTQRGRRRALGIRLSWF